MKMKSESPTAGGQAFGNTNYIIMEEDAISV
jgi:hypothetical protein